MGKSKEENNERRDWGKLKMEIQWARKHGNKGRSQRVPIATRVYLCPQSHADHAASNEEYVVLAGDDNASVLVPCISHMCTLRGKKCPSTYQLRPLNSSRKLQTRHLHGRSVPWTKSGCTYNLRQLSVPDHSKLMQYPKELSHLLSDLGDFDVESEASRAIFAAIAVNEVNSSKASIGTYDLVECGPIASGHSSDGLVLHFNFKARNIDEADAPVESFFTELVITNSVSDVNYRRLGPSSLLPDEVNTFGCLYCCSHNIHHFDDAYVYPFHNGREYLYAALKSQIQQLHKFREKCDEEGFIPSFSPPGSKYMGRDISVAPVALAKVALNLFNSGAKGAELKLVKLGSSARRSTPLGCLVHINFKAKNKDDPGAPLKTFFAEVIHTPKFILASSCVCLGPSNFVLPEEPKRHGCTVCKKLDVHHPPGPGYLNGREHFEAVPLSELI